MQIQAQRRLGPQLKKRRPNFHDWLQAQRARQDEVGALSRRYVRDGGPRWSAYTLRKHFFIHGVLTPGDWNAGSLAAQEYRGWLKGRRKTPELRGVAAGSA